MSNSFCRCLFLFEYNLFTRVRKIDEYNLNFQIQETMEIKSTYGRTIRGHMAGKRNSPQKIKDTIQIISKSPVTNIMMIMKGLCKCNYSNNSIFTY